MKGHVYCYHYTTCTKPGQWAVMCIITITLPVQNQVKERSCVLLPLHYLYKSKHNKRACVLLPLRYLYKARTMSGHVYWYHYNTCTKPRQWVVMFIVTITLFVQRQLNKRSCVLLPLHYLYKARTISGHVYCYHYTTCTKPGQWAVICIVTITLPVQNQVNERSCVLLSLHYLSKARTISGHVYCYHYTTSTKPGQWAVMCIVTIILPVQSQDNERSSVLLPLYYLYKASTISGHVDMCIVTITLPVQSQDNERSCVLLPLHYLCKVRTMSGHVYCYHYTTCTKPNKWAVICIVTITLPVQSHDNERSWILLPLHYLYKARAMCVMCIVTITLPVKGQVNERSCVLLPLHYLCKASTMNSHAYYYHYTTCAKPGQWAVMCIVTITLPVQSQVNERSCVFLR
jgi:hypothetical protein